MTGLIAEEKERKVRGNDGVWEKAETKWIRWRESKEVDVFHIRICLAVCKSELKGGVLFGVWINREADWQKKGRKRLTNPISWGEYSYSAGHPVWSGEEWPLQEEEWWFSFVPSSDAQLSLSSSSPPRAGHSLCWHEAAGCRGCCHLWEKTLPPIGKKLSNLLWPQKCFLSN